MSKVTKDEKCLVIGGNGFVGSHLVNSLAASGYEVYSYDRYSSGKPKHQKMNSIHPIVGDVYDTEKISKYIAETDYVFHSYSATTPAISDADPFIDIEGNLLNNVKIFDACSKNDNVKKLVYISSGGAIYGGEGSGREDDIIHPISPYAIAKFASERYLEYFKKKTGLQYIVYRLSNPYGKGQVTKNNQGVMPRFIDRMYRGEQITVYGDGSSSRDYIHVEDVANMIVETFTKDNKHAVYNLGSGEQTTLHNIIALLEALFDKSAEVVHMQTPDTFVHKAPLDMSRFEKEFGIQAETDLHTGLSSMLPADD